jgi:HD-GYP domain-containing protein (c-di-GMP phosphodiesterase class II)
MFNISDILKKQKDDKAKSVAPEQAEIKKTEESPPPQPPAVTVLKPKQDSGMHISSAFGQDLQKIHLTNASGLYSAALAQSRLIYNPTVKYSKEIFDDLKVIIESIVDMLRGENKEIVKLCLSDYSDMKDYLFYHVANVCIIALEIGLGLGYERDRLVELGMSAFLHDIGIIKFINLINKNKSLTREEFDKIKQHPKVGFEILNNIKDSKLPNTVLDVVLKEHERLDGSGYPNGIKGSQVDELVQIVGLSDTYEAKIHHRPYRRRYTPLETMKEISALKNSFTFTLIKVLIERLGIFPVGTLVSLNTKEAGIVIKGNASSPLRPVVDIIYDAAGKELPEPKRIDLSRNPVVYIEECLVYMDEKSKNLASN